MNKLKNLLSEYEVFLPLLTGLALLAIMVIGMMAVTAITYFEKYG